MDQPTKSLELEELEANFDLEPQCELPRKYHSVLKVDCSQIATHRFLATCAPKAKTYLVCANAAASAKDTSDPALCGRHHEQSHIVVTSL